ncbi:MAG: hypothetical protein ACI3XO_06100, partial [Eubacteriales bacterium]
LAQSSPVPLPEQDGFEFDDATSKNKGWLQPSFKLVGFRTRLCASDSNDPKFTLAQSSPVPLPEQDGFEFDDATSKNKGWLKPSFVFWWRWWDSNP